MITKKLISNFPYALANGVWDATPLSFKGILNVDGIVLSVN